MLTALLESCLLAEEQAIAIYEAEIFLLRLTPLTAQRRLTLELCLDIVAEERVHRGEILNYSNDAFRPKVRIAISRFAGHLLGVALSLIPSRASWRIHSWAEQQAAEIYRACAQKLAADSPALTSMRQAEFQEQEHSRRFSQLLSGRSETRSF